MKQYFYLVAVNLDDRTLPEKVFLQEYEAVKWGRGQATKSLKEGYIGYEYVLFKQEITRVGTLKRVKELKPYPTKELVDAGLVRGSDFDIDRERY